MYYYSFMPCWFNSHSTLGA